MTRKRAERLTGYEIRALPSKRCLVTLGAFDGSKLIAKASGRAEWLALRVVADRVYGCTAARPLSSMAAAALAVVPGDRCRSITGGTARTTVLTASKTSNLFVGTATV